MSTTKTTTGATAKRTTTAKSQLTKADNPPTTNKPEETVAAKEEHAPIKVQTVDGSTYVTVRSGYQGRLIYKSTRTGEKIVWGEFGEPQQMELRELQQVKNTVKDMYINNWFMFDEDWIPDFLGVSQYYRNIIPVESFDEVLTASIDEIERLKPTLSNLSRGQKTSMAYRARTLISEGKIDSRKAISTLEELLGEQLLMKEES